MKDTRPIEEQVASLTDEQRAKIPKIYKIQLIVTIIAIVAYVAVTIGCLLVYRNAENDYEAAKTAYQTSSFMNLETLKAYHDASEHLYSLYDTLFFVFSVTSAVVFVTIFALLIILKVKFPYYTEKRYNYMKKAAKAAAQS